MTDQIKDEKEFREFYQSYVDGQSSLSDLYHQTEELQKMTPNEKLDKTILAAAKKQTNKSHLVNFPSRNHTQWYSVAASFAIFSLLGLLVFNTWEAEKQQLEQDLSPSADMQIPTDYAPAVPLSQLRVSRKSLPPTNTELSKKEQPREEEAVNDSLEVTNTQEVTHVLEITMENEVLSSAAPTTSRTLKKPISATKSYLPETNSEADATTNLSTKLKQQSTQTAIQFSEQKLNSASLSASLTAQEWLVKIKKLVDSQEKQQARIEWQHFKKTYPDYPINQDYQDIIKQLAP